VTRVAPVHLEFFASVDEIALAKRELIEGLVETQSIAVLNADDPRVAAFAHVARGRVITFGASPSADFRAAAIEDRGELGTAFNFIFPGGSARLKLALVGRHNVENALAALAAASAWGIGAEEAAEVFPQMRPAGMRGQVLRFAEGFTVINDSYNSNPVALDAMVALLAGRTEARRRILLAGEMLELGPNSAELHHEAGLRAGMTGQIDWIIGVQGDASQLVRGAIEAGQPDSRAEFFARSDEAAKAVADMIAPGDLLLVKGSRGVKMERIVKELEARYAVEPAPATGEHS